MLGIMELPAITDLIPHRPPFLFVDAADEFRADGATCRRTFHPEEAFYAGHYPGNPITPGVLLCEATFQAAAAWLSQRPGTDLAGRTPVLSRIENAKFKRMVKPGDTIEIEVTHKETTRGFEFLRSIIRCEGKTVVTLDFVLAMVAE